MLHSVSSAWRISRADSVNMRGKRDGTFYSYVSHSLMRKYENVYRVFLKICYD
jgi:hypothetical protein